MSPPDLRVRRARPGDAAAIAQVHVETWQAAYAGLVPDAYLVRMTEAGQTFTWRRSLARSRTDERVLVAERAGAGGRAELVGFASYGPHRGRDLPYSGELYTLYVLPDWQSAGIGRRLLQRSLRGLYERGIPDCVVWVLAANPGRFFYERMGGERVAERQEAFAGTDLAQAAYAWPDLEAWLQQTGG